jgi:hypothetical protein
VSTYFRMLHDKHFKSHSFQGGFFIFIQSENMDEVFKFAQNLQPWEERLNSEKPENLKDGPQ